MDLIKKLTGKNPAEYEVVAKSLVENSDAALFSKLVKQDDFLFDFVKSNVATRIKQACNKDNYQNLISFFDYYSPSYDTMIAQVLYNYGGLELLPLIKEIFINGDNSRKAYATKFLSLVPKEYVIELMPLFRNSAKSDFEPLSINSIEILSRANDDIFRNEAIALLNSNDEFEQYNGVKYLVNFKAKDNLEQILNVMKQSSLAENIASEIPYLVPIEELVKNDDGILVLCNIVNAIPEILPVSAVIDYNLLEVFEHLYKNNLTSATALLLRLAQEKFTELTSNDEYLFDCDRNTKDEVLSIKEFLSTIDSNKLKSLLYDELFDESNFVFFAVDYVDEIEELETLLDSRNPTLILKVLSKLKELNALKNEHKQQAMNIIDDETLRACVSAL